MVTLKQFTQCCDKCFQNSVQFYSSVEWSKMYSTLTVWCLDTTVNMVRFLPQPVWHLCKVNI